MRSIYFSNSKSTPGQIETEKNLCVALCELLNLPASPVFHWLKKEKKKKANNESKAKRSLQDCWDDYVERVQGPACAHSWGRPIAPGLFLS